MAKPRRYNTDAIREKVFSWYAKQDHQDNCTALYNIANDDSIADIYETITETSEINALFTKTDLLILTANKYERNILHCFSHSLSGEKIKEFGIKLDTAIDFKNSISAYSFNICGYSALNIHTAVTGAYTNGGAADAIRYVLSNKYLYPVAVISFGICFGTKEEEYNLGDVILSEKVYPYFIGARVNGKELKVNDDNVLRIDESLRTRIAHVESKNLLNPEKLGFRYRLGNYTTGEAVVSSAQFRDKTVGTTSQPIIAGDMEAYGVFRECNISPYKIPCVVLKAICDWGIEKSFNKADEKVIQDYCRLVLNNPDSIHCDADREKAINDIDKLMDKLQAYAAKNAFDVLKILLENNAFTKSVYSSITDIYTNNRYVGVMGSVNWIRKEFYGIANNLGYKCDDNYIREIINLLEKNGFIFDVDESDGVLDNTSFKIAKM